MGAGAWEMSGGTTGGEEEQKALEKMRKVLEGERQSERPKGEGLGENH